MRARWVFQLSLIEVFCRNYSDWMTPRGRNRSSFQIVIKLQNSRSPKGRSTSIRRKIGNGSVVAKSRGDCAIAGVQRKIGRWKRTEELPVHVWPAGPRNWFSFLSEFTPHSG